MNKWSRPVDRRKTPASPAGARPATLDHNYFAFLSYSHADSADADWLHRELERFRVPSSLAGKLTPHGVIPKRLTPIFRDRHELAAAHDLGTEIREALAASHCLIVLCSPAAARSQWTNAEIEEFKRIHPEGCVIAAIFAGEPFASEMKGREKEECFPPALRQKYDRRGRATGRRAEPLAADLRENGDGRRLGLLKIVAGMLGVGLDDLVQRDHLRRQRRLAGIALASLAGMVVAVLLAVTAVTARDEARDQRRAAESLVAFMLGDLKDKLEPIGRLDVLDGVGSLVLEYYSKQNTSELSDAALLQRSQALSLTAQVAYLRGDMSTAHQLYRQAMHGTSEAVRRDTEDAQRVYDHAQNVFWVGEIARRRGDMDRAETAYREYKRLADRMVALQPDNLKSRAEVAYGEVNIGIVLYNKRRYAEAVRQFSGAVRTTQSLAAIEPGNSEYQRELSTMLAWLADAQRAQGRLEEAIRIRQGEVAHLRRLAASDPAIVDFRRRLIPAHQALGVLFSWTGEPASGIEQLRLSIAEADRLIPLEPENTLWKGLAAQARLELANALLLLGRTSEAASASSAGCGLAADVLARNPGVTWRRLQTGCYSSRSRLALAAGDNAEALLLGERALASAKTEQSADPIADRYSIAAVYRLLGDIRRELGNDEAARGAWTAGLRQLPENVAEGPLEMDERSELLKRLGRQEESRTIKAKLAGMGYRRSASG